MSNRRAQDERIEGTPDGSNAISEIVDVPDAPTIGTATASIGSASVTFTAATTGGTPSLYTATSTPGSITGTSATSPITVSGLTGGTAYTFTVTPSNSTGTGPASSSSNSVTILDLVNGYDALSEVTLSSTASSITFSGIPAGYDHLQIRGIARSSDGGGADVTGVLQFNSDTATNYSSHRLYAYGSSAATDTALSAARISFASILADGNTNSCFSSVVCDILDYADTNKFKTTRSITGGDYNTGGSIFVTSGNWRSTSIVSSITLFLSSGNWLQHSQFALYGVK